MNPDFEPPPFKSILTKEERALKERLLDGKPVKPPNSAYSLFSTKMLQSEEIKSCPLKDRMNYISGLWKNMSEMEKKEYIDQTKQLIEQYKLDYASYIKALPKEKRQEELKTLSKRKQKSMSEINNHTPKKKRKEKAVKVEVKEEEEEEEVQEEVSLSEQPLENDNEVEESLMAKIVALEPEQPPLNAFGLFLKNYSGKKPAKDEFNKLSRAEKRKLEKEVQNLKKAYIKDYEEFLNGLTKKQLKTFSKWSKKRDENKKDPEISKMGKAEAEVSSSSDSESDSSSSS
ncbi:nucleolar transcription factor 1-like [Agrilus planipennis]|nr:nucleolar transcription factor 1-like [Agrilus planipennis]